MGYISPTLAVRNMKQTIQFYRDSLGFRVGMAFPDADNPEYADLSKDGMVIMFVPAKNVGIVGRQKLGIGVNMYMQIDGDIDEYYSELKRKGVKIAVEIKDEPFGIRDFVVEDINGYKLTFNQVPKAVTTCMSVACLSQGKEGCAMDRRMSNRRFRLMTLGYKLRDLRVPRRKVLEEVDITPGYYVIDYGCGPGSYIYPLVELVLESGEIYALDIHPLAIRRVERIISKKHLANVEPILSDCETGLDSESLDVALLYEVFHHLSDREGVLQELHRVLKPGGILSFSDHCMRELDLVAEVAGDRLFRPVRRGRRTYTFSRE